ncbi:MAG TPA: hypothetical protein VL588_11815 [Bdellovibrionota bacterium]|nr:hypothetical protein [Bdellovibrionota bacterium]
MLKLKKPVLALALALAVLTGCGGPPGSRDFVGGLPGGLSPGGTTSGGTGGLPGTCYHVGDPVLFTGTGIQVDSNNIYAGTYPGGEHHGTVTMGGPSTGFTHSGTSYDGLIQMGFSQNQQAQITGVGYLQISSATQNEINGSNLRQSLGNPTDLCVTGVGVNLGRTTQNQLYGGYIYLYFNGTDKGFTLFF